MEQASSGYPPTAGSGEVKGRRGRGTDRQKREGEGLQQIVDRSTAYEQTEDRQRYLTTLPEGASYMRLCHNSQTKDTGVSINLMLVKLLIPRQCRYPEGYRPVELT